MRHDLRAASLCLAAAAAAAAVGIGGASIVVTTTPEPVSRRLGHLALDELDDRMVCRRRREYVIPGRERVWVVARLGQVDVQPQGRLVAQHAQ